MRPELSESELHSRLVGRVQFLLNMLCEVEKYPALYTNHKTLRNALRRYECVWVPLLARAGASGVHYASLAPPLDVQWVWMVHLLCPRKYIPDSIKMWASVLPDETDHVIDHQLLSTKQRKRAMKRARQLWGSQFPDEPFDSPYLNEGMLCDEDEDVRDVSYRSEITYDVIAACERQMMFHRHVAILPQYRHDRFISDAVDRYFMFLELKHKHRKTVLVPTFDTDIVWHTHMMHPISYISHTTRVCGQVVPHDDTITDREDGADLHDSWHETLHLWYDHFRSPFPRAGAMSRGNVSLKERLVKGEIRDAMKLFESEMVEGGEMRELYITETTLKRSPDNMKQWRDIKWMHAAGYETFALQAVRRDIFGGDVGERRVERFTRLEPSCGHDIDTLCTRMVYQAWKRMQPSGNVQYSTLLEVFKEDRQSSDGIIAYPIAAVHDVATNSICGQDRRRMDELGCTEEEKVVMIRVGGEDFAVMAGRWGGRFNGGDGDLILRIWLLAENGGRRWQRVRRVKAECDADAGCFSRKQEGGRTNVPGCYALSIGAGGQRKGSLRRRMMGCRENVWFDLGSGRVWCSKWDDMVAAYAIACAGGVMYVCMQPRCEAKIGESYYTGVGARQSEFGMLRGMGGESDWDGTERVFGVGHVLGSTS